MFTREQIVQGCKSIIEKFPANHVGICGALQDVHGNTCFLGQLAIEMAGPDLLRRTSSGLSYEFDPLAFEVIRKGVVANDLQRAPMPAIARDVAERVAALPPYVAPAGRSSSSTGRPLIAEAAPDVTAAVDALIAESVPELQEA
jgi:hypothetical protein